MVVLAGTTEETAKKSAARIATEMRLEVARGTLRPIDVAKTAMRCGAGEGNLVRRQGSAAGLRLRLEAGRAS